MAKAIGISETDLAKELRSGKTIAQVAKAHGVTTQKVIDALVTDAKAKLAAAVKAGRLTQAQADRIQTELTSASRTWSTARSPSRPSATIPAPAGRWPRIRRPARPVDGKASVAKAIGISETDLAKELRSGKTIAQVAKAHGVTTQKVIDALVADAKAKLAAAVKAGRLTQAQADRIQTGLTKRITTWSTARSPSAPSASSRAGVRPLHR